MGQGLVLRQVREAALSPVAIRWRQIVCFGFCAPLSEAKNEIVIKSIWASKGSAARFQALCLALLYYIAWGVLVHEGKVGRLPRFWKHL